MRDSCSDCGRLYCRDPRHDIGLFILDDRGPQLEVAVSLVVIIVALGVLAYMILTGRLGSL